MNGTSGVYLWNLTINSTKRSLFFKSILYGVQWAAILISIIIILGKVIGHLHFADPSDQIVYLQKLLFISSVTIFFQVFWGHRLPVVAGPSAILLIGVISSRGFDLSTIYSSVLAGGFFIFILAVSGLFEYLQRLFTASVVAVVLLLITFTLAPTIQSFMIDSRSGIDPLYNISFSLAMVFLMFLFYRILKGIWRATLIIWFMIAGSLIYYFIFPSSLSRNPTADLAWFSGFFEQMNTQLSFEPGVLISFIFCSIALSINDLGSIQSINELLSPSNQKSRLTRGISLTGLSNMVSGFFGVIGPVNYSLSPGVIMSTGCASRFILVPAAVVLFIMAFLPAATGFIGNVPSVVVGAVLAYTMTSQVAAGLIVAFREAGEEGFQYEKGLVLGLSILLGIVVAFFPENVLNSFPSFLRPVAGNGFVAGVVSALFLEHVVFREG